MKEMKTKSEKVVQASHSTVFGFWKMQCDRNLCCFKWNSGENVKKVCCVDDFRTNQKLCYLEIHAVKGRAVWGFTVIDP